jgi:hypothetical protein
MTNYRRNVLPGASWFYACLLSRRYLQKDNAGRRTLVWSH